MNLIATATAALAGLALASGATASTVTSIELNRSSTTTWSTLWNDPDDGGENVNATGAWSFLGNTGDQWNFSLDLSNNSTIGARIVSWGFDTTPTATGFEITAPTGWAAGGGQGGMDVDHCTYGGNNCVGGGGGGNFESLAAGDGLTFDFYFTSSENSITLDNFRSRFQSVGADGKGSTILTAISTHDDPTIPVPLPAAGWLMLAGIGGLVAMRRRKKV